MAATQFANANSAGTTLNNGGNMLSGDTSCTVTSAATLGSPTSPQFMILIDSELILVGAVAANVFSSLSRGQEGTTAAGHNNGAAVYCPPTAGMLTTAFLRADATNTGEVTGADFKASGVTLLGSPRSGRFVGEWTTTGAPTGLTGQVGDYGFDGPGRLWVCTVAGTPGTWTSFAMLGVASAFTADTTFSARVLMGAAVAKIVGGATSTSHRNNADTADNMIQTDVGLTTFRNALEVPPAAAATLATHSYGTLPVKIDEVNPSVVTTFTIGGTLPTGFKHLMIEGQLRGDTAAGAVEMGLRFNADAAGNYAYQRITVVGTTAPTDQESGVTGQTSMRNWFVSAASAVAGAAGAFRIWIPNYNGTTFKKTARISSDHFSAAAFLTAGQLNFNETAQFWNNTAALTGLTFIVVGAGNVSGSLTLYGIA